MNYQVQELSKDFNEFSRNHTGGIHLLGYSQGALLARTILQANPNHTVHTFISLSGPQAGQYGSKYWHMVEEKPFQHNNDFSSVFTSLLPRSSTRNSL